MSSSPSLSPQQFVAKWRAVALTERSSYQQHFLDLCRLVGHPTPADMDPTGTSFTFEAGAARQQGGQGWADVWKKGCFGWEYKGKHANLDRAYQQLLQYRESLQNPPLLVVSDTDQIVIHTNFTNTVKQVYTLALDDLLTPAGMQRLRALFYEPTFFRAPQTTEQVTREAAEQFARLAALLRKWEGADEATAHRIAHFLIRLLFCLFAEDIGLLPNQLFTQLINSTRTRPPLFAQQLGQLFATMATGGFFAMADIPYFNGRLFDDAEVLELDSDGLEILHRVSRLDWSSIEPAILGTLFERSLDPSKRAQLGAHYTSRDDILLIVEPVLMAPLRRRWADVQAECRALAENQEPGTKNRSTANQRIHGSRFSVLERQRELLLAFAHEIASVRVLDPACGSGNFLYVALKQLLDLEKEVIRFAADIGVGGFFPTVSPEQLRGIEINEYAHELASITVWIGYIQWLRDNGFGQPSEPILKTLDTIRHMDALMAFDDAGQPYEPAWPEADVIVGNPPFVGGNKVRQELGSAYVDALFTLYDGRVPAFADLVTYFFERARALIEAGTTQRAGLLATNSIRGGANRKVLERIKQSGDIFMAWSDRPWILDGAAVRVSMVGFDGSHADTTQSVGAQHAAPVQPMLNGMPVAAINADLTGDVNLGMAKQLNENAGLCFMGPSPKAPFDIDSDVAQRLLAAPLNVNGRPNSDVVRPVASAVDLVQRARNKWTVDFGVMTLEQAAEYEKPFEYVQQHVYPVRSKNRRAVYAEKWWQYAEARPGMRKALHNKRRYIATPGVAKHRIFVWVQPEVLCNQGTLVFAREDDYFFGVLHSRAHELWALRMGTSLEDRPRYTPTTTFETFPFPWPPGQEPADDPRVAAIAEAARELVEKRERWLNPPQANQEPGTRNHPIPPPHVGESAGRGPGSRFSGSPALKDRTLTNLYNQRPTWLDLAHQKLDRAVFAAYGWPHDLPDEALLERLLALNAERAGG